MPGGLPLQPAPPPPPQEFAETAGPTPWGYWEICYKIFGDGLYVEKVIGSAGRTDNNNAKSIHLEYIKAGGVHWKNGAQSSTSELTETFVLNCPVSRAGNYCAKLWIASGGSQHYGGEACIYVH
ncbi:hypothetical protein QF032_000129 [Streptomyces achromogenes]|uniref:hypothetical protein n=1 Tax=Streptomyces achromogenes TaxID=67255 RepID=UPI002785B20D|nr:hypothetical protein [Streptomyces achromogenes]MDQ0828285.1 hypothetical protein [Streptomyces achromogenes]